MGYLTDGDIDALANLAVEHGLDGSRAALFLQPDMNVVRGKLQQFNVPLVQQRIDLSHLNNISRLSSGTVPLLQWVANARALIADAEAQARLDAFSARIRDDAEGRPVVDIPDDAPEIKEEIIHHDDMVPYGFLEAGRRAGQAVFKVSVFPFEDGAPLLSNGEHAPHLGTGWLIGPDLMITNHHVLNARPRGAALRPPLAAEADLALQARHLQIALDFEDENVAPAIQSGATLVCADPELDYALLRVDTAPEREPLALNPTPLEVADTAERVAVNIIQHPLGRPKRVAVRNNLVYKTTSTDVRYFTDTEQGSSGSPVFDDQWHVVALHRGAKPASGVKFQGKSTAWVNVGTQIAEITRHIEASAPGMLG